MYKIPSTDVSLLRNILAWNLDKIKKKFLIAKVVVGVMQKIRPDLDIGRIIKWLRKAAGLTQDQVLAKMQLMGLNISKSTYAKIETNRMNIKVSELVALKEIFGAEYQDFFQGL